MVHEDAAPYAKKGRSVNALQWGPLLVSASDLESRFIHHGYTAKKGDPAETARRAWSKFWEDVDHIAEGKDHDGLFVAQDGDGTIWKFVFTFCENDFDMDVEHGLPNYKKAKLFCKHCRATNSAIFGQNPYPHSDHRPDARWRGQCKMSNDEFKHRFVRPHPMTGSKYFNKYTCRNDLMHAMDHHGVYGVIFASVLWYLVHNDGKPSLGSTQAARIEMINVYLKDFYRRNPGINSRIDRIDAKNINSTGPGDYAALGGPHIKAANTRQAMPFLKDIANRVLLDADDIDHVLMHKLIDHTLDFNRVIYGTGVFCTEREVEELKTACVGIGKYMQTLRGRAKKEKQLIWAIKPKLHYMQHFPDEARLISPRMVQCYIEESFIGKVAGIWSSSKSGPYSETIQHVALVKYLVWLSIELNL